MVAVEFTSQFSSRYQRNNKRTGQKNLRCFPQCCPHGHMNSGFCGQPVSCVVSGVDSGKDIKVWGEIDVCGGPDSFMVGKSYSISTLTEKSRCRDRPIAPYFRGDIKEAPSQNTIQKTYVLQQPNSAQSSNNGRRFEVTFNSQMLGWHYAWVASKHTCDSYHTFVVHVFIGDGLDDKYAYLGSGHSPNFQLYSRRRQRGVQKDMPGLPKRIKTDNSLKQESGSVYQQPHLLNGPTVYAAALDAHIQMVQGRSSTLECFNPQAPVSRVIAKEPPALGQASMEVGTNNIVEQIINLTGKRMISFINYEPKATSNDLYDELDKFSSSIFEDIIRQNPMLKQNNNSAMQKAAQPKEDFAFETVSKRGLDASLKLLKEYVLADGSDDAKAKIDKFVEVVHGMGEFFQNEQEMTKEMNEYFSSLSTKQGLHQLVLDLREEKQHQSVDVKYDLDAMTFSQVLKQVRSLTPPNGIMLRVRYILFKHIGVFLFKNGVTLPYFYEILDIAAQKGMVAADTETFPTNFGVKSVYTLVQKDFPFDVKPFLNNSTFISEEHRQIWRRAASLVRRKLITQAVIVRVMQERAVNIFWQNRIKDRNGGPVEGRWRRVIGGGTLGNFLGLVGGVGSNIIDAMIDSMFKTVTVGFNKTKKVVCLMGIKKVFSDASVLLFLDAAPRILAIPQPMPFANPKNTQVCYTAWLHTTPNNTQSGASFEIHIVTTLLRKLPIHNNKAGSFVEAIKRSYMEGGPLTIDTSKVDFDVISSLLHTKGVRYLNATRVKLAADGSNLELKTKTFAFDAASKNTPQMNQRSTLECLFDTSIFDDISPTPSTRSQTEAEEKETNCGKSGSGNIKSGFVQESKINDQPEKIGVETDVIDNAIHVENGDMEQLTTLQQCCVGMHTMYFVRLKDDEKT